MRVLRPFLSALGVALLAFVQLSTPALAGGADVRDGTFTFGPGLTCQQFPEVLPGLGICGTSGSVDYHIVITPTGAENSHFAVSGFTGCVTMTTLFGTACLPGFWYTNASALVLIHLGAQPSKPIILINDGPGGAPHMPVGPASSH